MKDLSPEEAGRWLEAAPAPIQDAVTNSSTSQILEQIGKSHSLHVDLIDLLSKLVSYMLVGYISPQEFSKELISAGIPNIDTEQILKEVNEKIFVPLHEKIRTQGDAEGNSVQEPTKSVPITPVSIPTMSTPMPKTLNRLALTPDKLPDTLISKAPMPSAVAVVTSPMGAVRTSLPQGLPAMNRLGLLSDHEEPHINLGKPVPVTSAVPMTPRPQMPAPAQPSAVPPPKNYSIDPYREQVEEHEK